MGSTAPPPVLLASSPRGWFRTRHGPPPRARSRPRRLALERLRERPGAAAGAAAGAGTAARAAANRRAGASRAAARLRAAARVPAATAGIRAAAGLLAL